MKVIFLDIDGVSEQLTKNIDILKKIGEKK